jgi:nucleoside-diphosphate-sugar epimerase
VLSTFVAQALQLQGADITIYGDKSQARSLCYIDNLIAEFLVVAAP